jgi:stage V sporulation protein G
MQITDVKIRRIFPEGECTIRAIVSVTLDDSLALHDMAIVQGAERVFVSMPNRRNQNGGFQDIVHPINSEFRRQLEEAVINKYKEEISKCALQKTSQTKTGT